MISPQPSLIFLFASSALKDVSKQILVFMKAETSQSYLNKMLKKTIQMQCKEIHFQFSYSIVLHTFHTKKILYCTAIIIITVVERRAIKYVYVGMEKSLF